MDSTPLPRGFRAHVANVGIKDETEDLVVVVSEVPCNSAAMFTRSRFSGPSVTVSRANSADHTLQALVVVSKNANVATGEQGLANARALNSLVAASVGVSESDVLVASTGVIGRQYPMDRLSGHFAPHTQAADLQMSSTDALAVARAMMTTDTHPKVASASIPLTGTAAAAAGAAVADTAVVVGVAKGVGMIEPNMATMLSFIFTDAEVSAEQLDEIFRPVVERTFNSLSIDTDTSTSDTTAILANGMAGTVDPDELRAAVESVCLDLTRQLARDGEGATKLLVVSVKSARDEEQAKRVAKAVVNSPLVKTAVHGADPNWGRVAMAVGKCSDDTDIVEKSVRISFGGAEVYPTTVADDALAELEKYLSGDEIHISVDLGIDSGDWTVYGCDLSDGYVRINADYTT